MVSARTIWLTLAFIGAAGAVSQGRLSESTFVPVPTPPPAIVTLEAGHPSVMVTSAYERTLPAQRATLRLVVTGAQVPGTKQLADIPAIVPGPLFDVSDRDLQTAEQALAFQGIPKSRISVVKGRGERAPADWVAAKPAYTVMPGTPQPSGFSTTPLVAQLLIDVDPLTDSRWSTIQSAMLRAVAQLNGSVRAVPAGYVVYRTDCGVLDAQAHRSMHMQLAQYAAAVASAAGYAAAVRKNVSETGALDALQARETSCGPLPPLPYYAWNKVPTDESSSPASVPTFHFAKDADEVAALTRPDKTQDVPIHNLVTLNTAVGMLPMPVAHRLFAAEAGRHVISAYGSVNAFVRPDYAVLQFPVGGRNVFVPPEIPARDAMIVRQNEHVWMFVRVRDYSVRHIRQILNLLKLDLDYASTPGVAGYIANCDGIAAAVLARTVQDASDNGDIITHSAHVRKGRLLGIIDKGIFTNAVCGVRVTAPIAQAVAAYRADQDDPALLRFSRQATTAWEMLSDAPTPTASFSPIPAGWLHTAAPSDWNAFSLTGLSTEGVDFDHIPVTRAVVIYPGDFAGAITALGYHIVYRFDAYNTLDSDVVVAFEGKNQADLDAAIDAALNNIRQDAGRSLLTVPVYLADCSAIARADLAVATRNGLVTIGGRAPISLVQEQPTYSDNQVACNYSPEMYPIALRVQMSGSTPMMSTAVTVYPDLKN